MPYKYDINTDHLKCNFCTQWFSCSQHYANIQRYSLKACTHCLQNFNFTIIHPNSYKLFKVFLFDTNIHIQLPGSEGSNQFQSEIQVVEQEVKDAISRHFQEKIRQVMKDLELCTKNTEEHLNRMRKEETEQKLPQNHFKSKLKQVRQKPVEFWLKYNQKSQMNIPPKLTKTKSTLHLSRKSSTSNIQKQNINVVNSHNKFGWGKSFRDRIAMKPLNNLMKSSMYSDTKKDDHSKEKYGSLGNSVRQKSSKNLAMSTFITSITREDRDLNEITKLLESYKKHNTYLPFELEPQSSIIVKNESKRTHADTIIDIRQKTSRRGQLLELIGSDVSKINFQCFLQSLGELPQTKVVRIIKAGMTDFQFDSLLRFIAKHLNIETLIVTNNRLTQISLAALHTFRMVHKDSALRHVYLGSNRIGREQSMPLIRVLGEMKLQTFL